MLHQFYPQIEHNYKFELNKDMNFSAAHFIPSNLAGKCKNIHGHTYFINVTICGNELDEAGFLADFKSIKNLIHDKYDHTLLNDHEDVFDENNLPSTEVVSKVIWDSIQTHLNTLQNKPKCLQVIVRETPTSYVIYRPRWREF